MEFDKTMMTKLIKFTITTIISLLFIGDGLQTSLRLSKKSVIISYSPSNSLAYPHNECQFTKYTKMNEGSCSSRGMLSAYSCIVTSNPFAYFLTLFFCICNAMVFA